MIRGYLVLSVFAFSLIQLAVTLANLREIRRLDHGTGDFADASNSPLVSVLVPARNEEENIRACLESLLQQDYPNYEVLVLDDHSSDDTPTILAELKRNHEHLRVLTGAELPDGWFGKHWACWQLADQASGSWILFTDADTVHQPELLKAAVARASECKLDLPVIVNIVVSSMVLQKK